MRSGWDSHPQGGFHRSPVFGTGAVGLSASRSNAESERFELPRRSSRPAPLPTVLLVPSGHSPRAEGERIERPQGSHPDLRLATGCLTNSASLPYAGRDLHPHAPFGTRASGARASAFRHQRLEWPARFELALRPWQGRVLPLTLRPHGAPGEIRTHDLRLTEAALCPLELQRRRSGSRTRTCVCRFQGPAGMPATHPGMEPSPGADPGLLPYRGRVTAVCDGGAPRRKRWRSLPLHGPIGGLRACAGAGCPRCDSNAHCPAPHAGTSSHWATRTWSRHPVPTRTIRRTKAKPQPCAAA